jgi:hypothetical protein
VLNDDVQENCLSKLALVLREVHISQGDDAESGGRSCCDMISPLPAGPADRRVVCRFLGTITVSPQRISAQSKGSLRSLPSDYYEWAITCSRRVEGRAADGRAMIDGKPAAVGYGRASAPVGWSAQAN